METEPWRNISERRFFRVTIDDDGPGLAAELRQAALSRGQSASMKQNPVPASGSPSSRIWPRFMVAHLTLDDSPKGGLRATFRLPSA